MKKYKCKVSNKINQKDSCGKCPYTGECNDKLSTMIRIYLDMLCNSIKEDSKGPTHVHYQEKKNIESTSFDEKILVLDSYGSTIIARKKRDKYLLISGYRNTEFSNVSDMELALKKVMNDHDWIKRKNMDLWNVRLQYDTKKNVTKHLKENWL